MKKLVLLIALALAVPAVYSQDPVVSPAGAATTIGGINAAAFVVGTIVVIGAIAYAVSQNNEGQNVFVTVTASGTR